MLRARTLDRQSWAGIHGLESGPQPPLLRAARGALPNAPKRAGAQSAAELQGPRRRRSLRRLRGARPSMPRGSWRRPGGSIILTRRAEAARGPREGAGARAAQPGGGGRGECAQPPGTTSLGRGERHSAALNPGPRPRGASSPVPRPWPPVPRPPPHPQPMNEFRGPAHGSPWEGKWEGALGVPRPAPSFSGCGGRAGP